MVHRVRGKPYLFNLIDTPGHADFSYEVSRSLAAVQGALLVVDATVGVQAQTLSHYLRARDAGVRAVLPVLNKVDLPTADVDAVIEQLEAQLGIDVLGGGCHLVSAKTGMGVEGVLEGIVDRIPAPSGARDAPFRGLLLDSWFQAFRGAVCLVALFEGRVVAGQQIRSAATGKTYTVEELGILQPHQVPVAALSAGQVGYLIMGIKSATEARIGDTLLEPTSAAGLIPGFKAARPTMFAGFFPAEKAEFEALQGAIEKLLLNDASVHVSRTTSAYLGTGWRLGFLGTLHLDVFRQRLEQEFQATMIVTAPTVEYTAHLRDGTVAEVNSVDDYPERPGDLLAVREFREPMAMVSIVFPVEHTGCVMQLCSVGRAGPRPALPCRSTADPRRPSRTWGRRVPGWRSGCRWPTSSGSSTTGCSRSQQATPAWITPRRAPIRWIW